jgi:hypothetical protein
MVDGLHIRILKRTMKPLAIALTEAGKSLQGEGRDRGVMSPMYNISLLGISTMNPPCTMNIS